MKLRKSRSLRRSERKELNELRNLYINLMNGYCVNISPELVRLLMQKDWSNG